MTMHLMNCFTCNARWPGRMKTGTLCLLIETDQGLVLVDTGLGLQDYSNPTGIIQFYRTITFMPFDPHETAAQQVMGFGYKPEDVRQIILTHMHFDHCGGLPDFPHAKVHVHKREYDAFTDGKILHWDEYAYIPRNIAHKPKIILYEKTDSKWYDFDAIRLPFTPEMSLIPLFGHSRGHCGVAVKTTGGWFFHAADAGAVNNDKAPAWLIRWALGPHDPLLRAFMKSHPEVLVSNSHMFPEFFEKYRTID
jgi:glyoxylase-like metal-dependent hydrolase (beta-lactamase superfamily II)